MHTTNREYPLLPPITCYHYPSWQSAHAAHLADFVVYTFDLLSADELCVPGITSYIGSAGANAKRDTETKSSTKGGYFKSSLDGRYRGGSYTKNHTRPQDVVIYTFSRNTPLLNETKKSHQDRVNTPGFKIDEREMLGVLEYQLHQSATQHGIVLNNGEIPKSVASEYRDMTPKEFFDGVTIVGSVPMIVRLSRGEITMAEIRDIQRRHAIGFADHLRAQFMEVTGEY